MNYEQFWEEVRKEKQAIDEKIRGENAHPELFQPFKEPLNSQRFLLIGDDMERFI